MVDEAGRLLVDGTEIAWRRTPGSEPTILWLGGFRSEMTGAKSQALAARAAEFGRDFLRFDYFGHGESGGTFKDGAITRWRADALALIDTMTEGPLVLVGSSMGGWLACLAALARPDRMRGLVLVAPAVDFTSALLEPKINATGRAALERDGVWRQPGAHEQSGYPITRALLEDGARWTILPGPISITTPTRILQGGADTEVPWRHALELALALESEDVVFNLIRDGDHRLSRPNDLARLIAAVAEVESI